MIDAAPIYLPPDGGLIGLRDGRAVRLEPADIPAGTPLLAIVPGEDVLVTDAEVPPVRQSSRRYQAARYALEDRLATPIENLHLALGARASDGTHPAAVVDRDCMENWLATFGDARDRVTAGLVPDYLCLPVPEDDAAVLWLTGNRALLRRDATHGLACEQDLLAALLRTEDAPNRLDVRAQADTDADALLERLRDHGCEVNVRDRPAPETLQADLLSGAATRSAIDLLQDRYAPVSAMAQWWRPLRATAILAAAWLILATTAQGLHYYQLQQRHEQLRSQIENRFREAFPEVQTVNNVRVQAEEEIRKLRAARGTDGLFPLLAATARTAGGVPGLRMESLQYRNGELFANLRGESVQSVEQLRTGFAETGGATLTVQSADASEEGVDIRARISPENS